MYAKYLNTAILASALAFSGCATKKYVAKTTAPIKGQVDQVEAKVNDQGKQINSQQQQIENQTTGLAATNERAVSADQRAGDALNRADQAGQKADAATTKADTANTKADTANSKIAELSQYVANLDDYKAMKEASIPFAFDRDILSKEAKEKLDELVAGKDNFKHYFIAVEGFTDLNGSPEYNAALSRRRADRVVQYLVAQQNIPIYRIHMVGLGAQKPAEQGRTRVANAANRRVEVTIYTSDNANGNMAPAASPTASNR
jgi:outer membrane protein OmpA-like peptidoglycan-associated protein